MLQNIGSKLGVRAAGEVIGEYGMSSRRRRERRMGLAPKLKSRRRKAKSASVGGTYQHGFYVPKNTDDALRVDKKAGNHLWRDAIIKEATTLMNFNTFQQVKTKQQKKRFNMVRDTYQFAPLRCIYAVKEDGTRKCRTIIGGHVVKTDKEDTYASNMKTISARVLMCIAAANSYDILVGDVTSAYLHAPNKQRIYTRLCPEFELIGFNSNEMCTVEQALYVSNIGIFSYRY